MKNKVGDKKKKSKISGFANLFRSGVYPDGEKRITLWNGLGFGVGDIYGGGSGGLTGTYLTLFWTMFAGLTIDQSMTIQGTALIVSSFTAFVVGSLSDNLYKFKIGRRLGRRRFFLLTGSPIILLTIGMWFPGLSFVWYALSFLLWTILIQYIMIPYATLPSEMTKNFDGRTVLSTTRMFLSGLVQSVVPLIGGVILAVFGNKSNSYTSIGVMWTVVFAICVFIAYKNTWETPVNEVVYVETSKKEPKLKIAFDVIKSYFSTFKVSAFRKHISIYLLGVSFADVFAQVFVFFVIYNLNKTAAFASMILSLAVVWQPLTPVQGWLFAKLGVRGLYSVTFIGCITSLFGYWFIWKEGHYFSSGTLTAIIIAVTLAWLFFKSLVYFTPWNVFPFIPDIDELITGERREGTFSATLRLVRTMTQGISSIVVGKYLSFVGFASGSSSQTVSAINGIGNVLILWVSAGFLLAWIIALSFKLNKKTHETLVGELNRLKQGGLKSDVDPETRKVVENLTGVKYSKLWPLEKKTIDDTL
jgi:oligogalacturonide transporter